MTLSVPLSLRCSLCFFRFLLFREVPSTSSYQKKKNNWFNFVFISLYIMVKQLLLFDKQKLHRRISLLKRKDVCLRILRLYIVRNCMNWNFISVPSVIRCTLRFFLFFLFRGDSSSPRYVKKNSQELSFIIKLRHRFSLIRKLIKRFCNYACCPISQVFKRTDLPLSSNKEIRILL